MDPAIPWDCARCEREPRWSRWWRVGLVQPHVYLSVHRPRWVQSTWTEVRRDAAEALRLKIREHRHRAPVSLRWAADKRVVARAVRQGERRYGLGLSGYSRRASGPGQLCNRLPTFMDDNAMVCTTSTLPTRGGPSTVTRSTRRTSRLTNLRGMRLHLIAHTDLLSVDVQRDLPWLPAEASADRSAGSHCRAA